jgi:hypothetical protein
VGPAAAARGIERRLHLGRGQGIAAAQLVGRVDQHHPVGVDDLDPHRGRRRDPPHHLAPGRAVEAGQVDHRRPHAGRHLRLDRVAQRRAQRHRRDQLEPDHRRERGQQQAGADAEVHRGDPALRTTAARGENAQSSSGWSRKR